MSAEPDGLAAFPPESDRYRARLILLHGLWTAPGIWRAVALAFAHRGWWCEAPNLRVDGGGLESWQGAAGAAIELGDRPAIAIGYDLGALVALELASCGQVEAAIAIAPPLDGLGRALGWGSRLGARLGVGPVAPPALGHAWLDPGPGARPGLAVAAFLCPESAALIASCRGRALQPRALRAPVLLADQASDPMASRSLMQITAAGLEADFDVLPGGRLPMLAARIDAWVSVLQRWLVRRLGPELLLLRGDEDLVEDA